MTSCNFGSIVAMSGVLGAVVAFGISFSIPKSYVSMAVLKLTPQQEGSTPGAAIDRINAMDQRILSRTVLTRIINNFGLYQKERSRMPIEDVIESMRKSIAVSPVVGVENSGPRAPAFAVRFTYQDRFAAQRVTQDLVSRYIDENLRQRANSAAIPMTIELLDPASLPMNPVSPKRPLIATMGLALGLALGAVGALVRHVKRPRLAASGILEKSPAGTPVFLGTNVPVQALLEYLESDKTLAQFLSDFPAVTREAAVSALDLAKSFLVQ
jgi:uncharacterized protein involved in exopolysaccharide biosynthesis/uncharacterized protein (DUF433 family)